MADCDPELGKSIHLILTSLGIETPTVDNAQYLATNSGKEPLIKTSMTSIVCALGLDISDDSIKDTPNRVAKMYANEVFYGLDYDNFPKCTTVENKMHYDEVVAVNKIQVLSLCEHHFVPFTGYATVAYIPKEHVLGLSKFNRVVDFFARRPQIQERLTEQVSAALKHILHTEDVAIMVNAEHLCVKLRGVKDANSNTVTSKLSGRFREDPALRSEFFALARQ